MWIHLGEQLRADDGHGLTPETCAFQRQWLVEHAGLTDEDTVDYSAGKTVTLKFGQRRRLCWAWRIRRVPGVSPDFIRSQGVG